jgi:hypothetical protein
MTTIKKQTLKVMLCAIAFGALQPTQAAHDKTTPVMNNKTEPFINDKVLGLSFASAALGLAVMNEELADSDTFEKLAQFINIDKDDLAPCVVFSLALAAASYIPDGAGRTVLRAGAVLPILVAACLPKKALHKLAQLPGIRHYFEFMKEAKGLPLIGDYAQCNQLSCKGLCHKCKARKLFLTVPLAAIPFIPTVYRSFKNTVARWERERIEQADRAKIEREKQREQQHEEEMRRAQEKEAREAGAKANQEINHYRTLGINQNATQREIRQAHRRLALQFHPDKAVENNITADEANRRMQQLNEANDVLSNPLLKAAYDLGLRNHRAPQPKEPKKNSASDVD